MRGHGVAAVVASLVALAVTPSTVHATGTLTVAVDGAGRATAPGIDCGEGAAACTHLYVSERICEPYPDGGKPICYLEHPYVRVTATPRSGFALERWEGCDASYNGGPSCPLIMTQSRSVRAIFVDNTGPAVQLLEPGPEARRGRIRLRAAASDNVGVTGIDYFVRGEPVGSTTAPEGVTVDTSSVADGQAVVKAVATDASGKSAQDARMVLIDNTAPVLAVAGADSGRFAPGRLTWTIDAADSVGIATVECSLVPRGAPASFGPCSGRRRSHSATLRTEGAYAFLVRTVDTVGNITTSRALTVTIDRNAGRDGGTGGSGEDATGLAGFQPLVRNSFRTIGRWTRFLSLSVSNLPRGGRAVLSCRGRGCPVARRSFESRRGRVSLVRALNGRRLPAGTRLTVRAVGPGGEQKLVTFTMRRAKAPRRTVRCAPPGRRLGRCA
jgi:hypothetical protein